VTGDLREKDIEEIKAKLYCSYLHTFHSFCMELGGVTAEHFIVSFSTRLNAPEHLQRS
jgi:hypothetical protein